MTDNTNLPNNPDTNPPDDLTPRVDRLSGDAAPDLTPEEFARLQNSEQAINIDARGRVRVDRGSEDSPGIALRKRRAWYAH
jgi:hypothetical protein